MLGAGHPTRHGGLDHTLATFPIDDTIVDDPSSAPGSGADRLIRQDEGRRVEVTTANVECRQWSAAD